MSLDTLKNAIDANDAAAIASLLATLDKDIDDYVLGSLPPVLWAAAQSRTEAVKVLLEAGARPANFPDALHRVIFLGARMSEWEEAKDVSALKLLLDAGCDPNGLDEQGDSPLRTCLLSAAHPGRAEAAARLLLSEGADPSRTENADLLHMAVKTPASGVVAALLEAGVDPNAEEGGVVPALSCVMELFQAFARTRENPEDNSAEVAAEFCEENLRLLIEHGADVSVRTEAGHQPLQIVFSTQDSPETIKAMLLDAGAPGHDTIGAGGQDVDFLAISMLEGHSGEFVRRLYDAGCPIDVPYALFGGGSWVRVAPHYAPHQVLALCKHSEAVRQAFVDFRSEKGFSPLLTAISGGDATLVKYFLGLGLTADQTNEDGVSIREHVAAGNDSEKRLELLIECEAALG